MRPGAAIAWHGKTFVLLLLPLPLNRQIREVLSEADENADNVIEYREFVPFMVDILQGIKVWGV